jgi:hypothetical protein
LAGIVASCLRKQRCLIAVSGFYQWLKTGAKQKQPYYLHRRDDKPFAIAGLGEAWNKAEEPVESCTILTTEANDLMRPLHDRMPVILDGKDFDRWLDPAVQEPKKLVAHRPSSARCRSSSDGPQMLPPAAPLVKCAKPLRHCPQNAVRRHGCVRTGTARVGGLHLPAGRCFSNHSTISAFISGRYSWPVFL